MKRTIAIIASLLVSFVSVAPLHSSADELPTRIASAPSAPVAMTNCRSDETSAHVTITNRTSHALLTFSVQFKAYDSENTMIGSSESDITINRPLTSGDSDIYTLSHGLAYRLSEPQNAFASVTCRIVAATFTGRHAWQYGQTWSERLLAVDNSADSSAPSGRGETSGAQRNVVRSSSRGPLKVEVVKSWNDTREDGLYIHDVVALTAGATPVEIEPYQLVLTMHLANGADKTYQALNQAAPSYEKFNPLLNQTTDAPEVDPSEDFGKIGRLTIQPNVVATVTVTFVVPEPVADPAQNTDVALDQSASAPATRTLGSGESPSSSNRQSSDRSSNNADAANNSDSRRADAKKSTQKPTPAPKPKATKPPGEI